MKVSEITPVVIAAYIRLDEYDAEVLQQIYEGAVAYVMSYTGLTREELELHEDISTAILVLCQDAYDNRSMYVDKNNVNKTVETILNMHSRNLL